MHFSSCSQVPANESKFPGKPKKKKPREQVSEDESIDEDDGGDGEDDTDDPVKATKVQKRLSIGDKRGKA